MEQRELFQEGDITGKVYLTGIIYRLTDPIEYLVVKPGRFKEVDDVHVPWMLPGAKPTTRDLVHVPPVSFHERVNAKVEKVIRAHVMTTIGIDITDIEFLLDPNHRMVRDVPAMAYFARYASGFPNESFGYHSAWMTLGALIDANVLPQSLREVKALDNIFRERSMYQEIERELGQLTEQLQTLTGFAHQLAPEEPEERTAADTPSTPS
ncbi:hypothetical protein GVX82_00555 [Patescibacteria group bacterium]|jgi:hypothetical protein|nr:hypothetical protein [Patescibacteria group bacterium]